MMMPCKTKTTLDIRVNDPRPWTARLTRVRFAALMISWENAGMPIAPLLPAWLGRNQSTEEVAYSDNGYRDTV